MQETVIITGTTDLTNRDKIMGFSDGQGGRFPGTKVGFPPFKFANGTYRHNVPENSEDRKFIEKAYLNGDSLDSPKGCEFLSTFYVDLSSDINFLNRENPKDMLSYYIAIGDKAEVAGSRQDLKANSMSPRAFVVEQIGESIKDKFSKSRKINIARGKLEAIFNDSPSYLVAVAQYLAPSSAGIKNEEDAYTFCTELIDGKYTDDSPEVGTNRFLSATEIDKEKVFVSADVKEAIYKNIIRKRNGMYILIASNTELGASEEAVINFLMADENQEYLGFNSDDDKPYSVRYLLNSKRK